MFVTDGFFANGLDVDEGAAEGSFRLGFVAVEEVELVEVGGVHWMMSGLEVWRWSS